VRAGSTGRMHIAIGMSTPVSKWLFPDARTIRKSWPDCDVDYSPRVWAFDALPPCCGEEVDLVVSSIPKILPGVKFVELLTISRVSSPRARTRWQRKPFVEAGISVAKRPSTYPVVERHTFLCVQPVADSPPSRNCWHRQVELTAVILLLVASNKSVVGAARLGSCARSKIQPNDYVTRPLTEHRHHRSCMLPLRELFDLEQAVSCPSCLSGRREARKLTTGLTSTRLRPSGGAAGGFEEAKSSCHHIVHTALRPLCASRSGSKLWRENGGRDQHEQMIAACSASPKAFLLRMMRCHQARLGFGTSVL